MTGLYPLVEGKRRSGFGNGVVTMCIGAAWAAQIARFSNFETTERIEAAAGGIQSPFFGLA